MSDPHELPNIPRDDKVVKRAFVPKQGAFSYFDYSSVEPRLAAYFASKIGHTDFAKLINAGIDPYTAVARMVTGNEDVTKEERQTWKVMFLSLMYGAGKTSVKEQFGVNDAGAKSMIRTFHRNFPAVGALQNMVLAVHARRGHIKTPWGRHLHAEPFGEHKLLNKLIQGSAADLMKAALIRVDAWIPTQLLDSHMVSQVHDEIQLDGPIHEVETLHEYIPRLMSEVAGEINEVVPIEVEHEVSTTSWADKVAYEAWAGVAA